MRIQQFCENHHPKRGEGIENDRLKAHHWFLLERLHDSLEPFYEATLCCEGNDNTLSEWFYTLDYVLDSIDRSKNEFEELARDNPESEDYAFLQAASAAAWLKTEDYYKKVDESAAYYAASVLNPAFKWSWFEDRWGNDTVKRFWLEGNSANNEIGVKGLVRELWEEEYKGKYGPSSAMAIGPRPRTGKDSSRPKNPDDRFGGLHRHKQLGPRPRVSSDHYTAFISTDCEPKETDALEFWNARYNTQPDLARFALDMLAIPMMSAECERVFSSAKRLLTDDRNRLYPDIIEANECLKHWFGKPEEEEVDQESEAPEKEVTAKAKKDNESDTEDDVVYEVDGDGEIVWKDY
jgi:hAT family C-terminal dimerisation region